MIMYMHILSLSLKKQCVHSANLVPKCEVKETALALSLQGPGGVFRASRWRTCTVHTFSSWNICYYFKWLRRLLIYDTFQRQQHLSPGHEQAFNEFTFFFSGGEIRAENKLAKTQQN